MITDSVRCWSMADDENPDCPIGSARCVLTTRHDGDHVWEARRLLPGSEDRCEHCGRVLDCCGNCCHCDTDQPRRAE